MVKYYMPLKLDFKSNQKCARLFDFFDLEGVFAANCAASIAFLCLHAYIFYLESFTLFFRGDFSSVFSRALSRQDVMNIIYGY